ncbi:hypothetical protein BK659_11555 [Pseudomonas brassicacearum]|uniref:Uncharacterized protein n=1 Tax=Pseudomonas brassicacearum TaxID=930166 RepID=A0A423H8S8_9PSED|nr:hypothetical protein BK659_11555 [Pseudomonas brassicacearum]
MKDGGSWDVSVTVPPGPISLVAEQFIGSADHSKPSVARLFKIRPAKLVVTVTPQPNERMKFSGAGFTGATVEISKVSGPGGQTLPPFTVSGGQWETTVSNWPPGMYTMSALQKVSGNGDDGDDWIPSESSSFSFSWAPPSPTEVTYTKEYTPTFSGKGYTGATVSLRNSQGSSIAPEVNVVNGTWSSKASQLWGPENKRLVRVQQRLSGQPPSLPVEIEVTIPPLAPAFTVTENGMSPTITGTCWPGAIVIIKFSGSAIEHKPSGASGNWTFRRDTPFVADVPHTVTVTQTFATLTSLPTSQTFTLLTPLLKPVITEPQKDQEVGRELIVRGTAGVKGATMKLRDAQYDRPLGEPKPLTSDGAWSIELEGLAFRKYTIDAIQSIGSRELRSDYCFFEVVVLPPTITVPASGGNLPRTSTISGTGLPGARVEVWLQGREQPLLSNVLVGENGGWKGEVTLPIGAKTIWARQTFGNEQSSKDSPRLTYNVVPAAPFIETPADNERVGRQVVVSGFGYSGDSVAVAFANAPLTVLGQGPVLNDRTWSVRVTLDRPGGAHHLIAVQSRDGFTSVASSERPVLLGSYLPTIDKPEQGRWVTDPVGFAGQGQVGVGGVAAWFNPEQGLVNFIPIAGMDWQATAKGELRTGGNWVRFAQIVVDGEGNYREFSDWADSERFEVGPQPPLSD